MASNSSGINFANPKNVKQTLSLLAKMLDIVIEREYICSKFKIQEYLISTAGAFVVITV